MSTDKEIEINKIYNMDFMQGIKNVEDKSIDLILTDPPYGTTNCDWDTIPDLELMWREFNRVIKDNGIILITATFKFAMQVILSNEKNFKHELIWEKTLSQGFANARKMHLRSHELILVFYKKIGTYNPQGLIKIKNPKMIKSYIKHGNGVYSKGLDNDYAPEFSNYPRSVLKFSNGNNYVIHPTQKPVELFNYLIKTFSNKDDTVLDVFMGSGTTAISCIETERNYIGFELNKEYFDKIENRIKERKKEGLQIEIEV